MKKLLAILLVSILFFGCTQQAQLQNPPSKEPVKTPPKTQSPAAKDTTPPELKLSGFAETTDKPLLDFSGTTEPSATVKVNDAAVKVANGKFSYSASLVEGENIIVVVAADKAGNKKTITKTIVYTKPQAPIDTSKDSYVPANGVVNTQELKIHLGVGPASAGKDGFDIDMAKLMPGSTSETMMALSNKLDSAVHLEYSISGSASGVVKLPAPVTLYKLGEQRFVKLTIAVPPELAYGDYEGVLTIKETRERANQ